MGDRILVRGYDAQRLITEVGGRPLWSAPRRAWVTLAAHADDLLALAEHERYDVTYRGRVGHPMADRRPHWRRAVYAKREGMTNGCRVLLLRLSDDMNAHGKVSIPRTRLAAEFGVAPARITEQIKLARSLGFLDIVRRARPKSPPPARPSFPRPRYALPYLGLRYGHPEVSRYALPYL